MKGLTASETCFQFFRLVIARHGCPETVVTDQGVQFTSQVFRDLCERMNINHVTSSAYHHQTNGKAERFNKYLQNAMAMLVDKEQSNWDAALDNALFVYRTTWNRTIQEKPFYLMYGRDPKLPQDVRVGGLPDNRRGKSDADEQRHGRAKAARLSDAHETAREARKVEQARYKQYYDKKQKEKKFAVGDEVMVHVPAPKVGQNYKLTPRWQGPFAVSSKLGPVTYELLVTKGEKSSKVAAHVTRLLPYVEWQQHQPKQARRETETREDDERV